VTVYAESLAGYLTNVSSGQGEPAGGRSAKLSARERDVLAGLASGDSTEQIALTLTMSPHTVRTHLRNVMRKLEARTRAHAVAIAIGDGAIEPPAY
jgi:DNA-binding CsgD family transcriptional regulator